MNNPIAIDYYEQALKKDRGFALALCRVSPICQPHHVPTKKKGRVLSQKALGAAQQRSGEQHIDRRFIFRWACLTASGRVRGRF